MPDNARQFPDAVVETRSLSRRFGHIVAANDINLAVAHAEIFAIVGPNGASKSTLMKMLTTLLPPTNGSAFVAGFDIRRQAASVRQHIGYVPQLPSADTELTGYENLLLSARLYLIPRRDRERLILEALDRIELTGAKDRIVSTYSGGMARRLEIAQSTLHEPTVLFLDEPTLGLDPNGRSAVWRHLVDLRERHGTAIVFSTPYMEEAEDLSDRMALVNQGAIAAVGRVDELKSRHGARSLDELFAKLTGTASAEGEAPR